jgi:hypothetical protein
MSQTQPITFYVYSDRINDFVLTDESDVKCPECDTISDNMSLDLIDRVRGEWMLQCPCGEQFYSLDD